MPAGRLVTIPATANISKGYNAPAEGAVRKPLVLVTPPADQSSWEMSCSDNGVGLNERTDLLLRRAVSTDMLPSKEGEGRSMIVAELVVGIKELHELESWQD